MRPEEALEAARRAATEMRDSGAYREAMPSRLGPPSPETWRVRLPDWASVDPDLSEVRSTRRLGAPITALKRVLLRLLSQYHLMLIAEITRFNVALLGEQRRLERRVAELEAAQTSSGEAGQTSSGEGVRPGDRTPVRSEEQDEAEE